MFSTLYTAISGLSTAQAHLYVTGHNMSNVNTPGYTRQQVVQSDAPYSTVGWNRFGKMQAGLGANVTAIRQIRNAYLDGYYRSSATTLGFYNVVYNIGVGVQDVFGEMEGEYKFQDVLHDLRNSISELSKDMTGVEVRGEFVSSCGVFADMAVNTYNTLRNQQNELNDSVINMVARINELVGTIKDYSRRIAISEAAGDNANDYRDTVNYALDELSSYLDIDYSIKDNFQVTIFCEGVPLLTNGVQNHLGLRYCDQNNGLVEVVQTPRTDILEYDEEARLLFRYDKDVPAASGNAGGALKGLLVARGTRTTSYTDTTEGLTERYLAEKAKLEEDPETNAKKLRLLELQYQRDMWNTKNAIIPRSMAQLDTLVHSVVTLINDTFAPTVESPPGSGTYVKAEPYPYGQDGSQGYVPIFVRNSPSYRYDEETGEILGEDANDFLSLFTIGNFTINPALSSSTGYKLMTLSPSGDASDNRLILSVLDAWDTALVGMDDGTKASVNTYYNRIISDWGIEVGTYKTICDSEDSMIQQTESARQQVSGVSLDEEMANMLVYQHAYNAAARMLNYVDSMIDKVINGTGRAGL